VRTVVWQGLDSPRMEFVRLEWRDRGLRASGTQLGVTYELRYELDGERLELDVVGERAAEVALDGCDFFDLGNSPLFNSLPVVRDGLLDEGAARDYVMRWVSVPELEVTEQPQRYEPLGGGLVRFSTGSFVADIAFDDAGLVTHYPDLAERLA
jgi:hypothetical protein